MIMSAGWDNCFAYRSVRFVGRGVRRVDPGEVSMCSAGVRDVAVSRTSESLRQAAAATAVTAQRVSARHRTTVLRTTGRQDAD